MYSLKKWILPDLDLREGTEVVNREVASIFSVSEPHILSYDTEENIVYHTPEEIGMAFFSIDKSLIKKWNDAYSLEEELHDATAEAENITVAVREALDEKCIRHFLSLFDYVEELLLSNYQFNNKDLVYYVITNKKNEVLTYLNGKFIFTDNIGLAIMSKTKTEAVEYNEKIEDEVQDLTYVKILRNGKIEEPREII